ncbi:CHC2 zinc finger domain-containing protein [Brevibacillus sp. AG]|uniref:CHC2 zinc finger domain-containing protein n=1 Tax=Brevibacillus sp. AG TaxID=3020891 RepID=UPI00232C7DF9|nr:CHC2 zinc finger domain-containing protein [Brevibacillus sp. AG]MDC0764264.1 CHC2 zinc finger domain-containing protein [Brevibacillus sp. AG]
MTTTYQFISQETIDYAENLPIIDLIEKVLVVPKRNRNTFICCPFHNEKTPSFNINISGNFFKCHGCGAGGNSAISFIIQYMWGQEAKGDKKKYYSAIEVICSYMNKPVTYEDGTSVTPKKRSTKKKQQDTNVPTKPTANMDLIKKANHLLLTHTELSSQHFIHLHEIRHLTKKTIISKGYRSFPKKPSQVAMAMVKELGNLEGIPGFYQAKPEKGDPYWALRGQKGFLIPVRNERLEITGFQYRLDQPRWSIKCLDLNGADHMLLSAKLDYETMILSIFWSGDAIFTVPIKEAAEIPVNSNGKQIGTVKVKPENKYLWLASTDLPKGTAATASYHIAVPTSLLDQKKSPIGVKRVGITEGPLKGDIAAEYFNMPFSCMPGLSNWRTCVEGALKLDADEYVIFLDADALLQKKKDYRSGNVYEDIGMTMEGIVKELIRAGKKVFLAAWDQKIAKGIDDLLIKGLSAQIFPIN